MPQVEDEGYDATLNNTIKAPFTLFSPEGHSEQESTSIAGGDEYDSPSPEHEQPIKSAGENVNLFDGELELGSISTSTGNAVASNNSIRTKNFQSVKENTDYSLSNDKGYQSVVMLYDENQNFISSLGSKTQFTTTATTKYIKWRSSEVNQETDLSVKYKLEQGTQATPYSPFGMGSITEKITNGDNTEEQTYSIYTQQPFRSIGDVRDVFFKNTVDSPYYDENLTLNGWYERHLPYIASYNNEVLPLDVYNEAGGIKYCNEKSMSTTGQFSLGASVQYLDESNWNCLLCTTEQTNILENIPSTFAGQTNVFSEDEVKAYLEVSGLYDLKKLINN